MKLKLHRVVGLVEDVVEIQDPWGSGMTLRVLRIGSRKFRRFQRERARVSPVQTRMNAAMARLAMKARLEGADVTEAYIEQNLPKFLEEAERQPLTPAETALVFEARVEAAVTLLEGWSGPGAPTDDKGNVLPSTEENKRELLTDPTPVPEELNGQPAPFAGYSLGGALVEVVYAAAEGADLLRNAWVNAAGKDSGPGSDGSSEPGPTSPPAAATSENGSSD